MWQVILKLLELHNLSKNSPQAVADGTPDALLPQRRQRSRPCFGNKPTGSESLQTRPTARRGKAMDESTFQKKLAELVKEIGNLPDEDREKLEALANQTKERHAKLRQTVTSLQESLDYLRLSVKYLLFDLEATRRENGYLRKMLEEQSDG